MARPRSIRLARLTPLGLTICRAYLMENLSNERWQQIDALFGRALDLDSAERDLFLKEIDDPGLRRAVERLLVAEAPAFLNGEAADYAAPLVQVAPVENGDVTAPGRQIGPYRIVREIGRGGMGTVYKARHDGLGRYAALKFLPPHLATDEKTKERFLAEAQAAAALDHPNICTIHDVGEAEDGRPFIAMTCYEGETLRARIARSPLPVEDALGFAVCMAEGLAAAHAAGIVHRDVKPANVMITEAGIVKLLDFGLARLEGSLHLTKVGARMGTVAYMSPEQVRGDDVDRRTDVWSLGVVLYEMLSGRRPFDGDHEQGVIYGILHGLPKPLPSLRQDVTPALARIVEKALAKEPGARYATLASLLRDLEALDASSGASPPSAIPQTDSHTDPPSSLLLEGERRQATVVVSYLSGYAALVEHLFPDEVEQVMSQLRAGADDVAQQHGGVVNQCSGDELVILFGVPVTHEDDAARAARAAHELHARLRDLGDGVEQRAGQPLRLVTGLDTGLVAAQYEGGACIYRIAGSPVQVATLLAARAGANEILASPESHRLLAPFFDAEIREPMRLKHSDEPVTPYRIGEELGMQSRLEAAEQEGLATHAGREKELAALHRSLDQAVHGEGQFVTVVGEAGLGKSRLLLEFRREIDAEAVQMLQGRCHSYGATIPYLPFIDALRDALSLRRDGSALSGDEIAERIRAVAPELVDLIPLYLHLLSVETPAYLLPKHLEGGHLRLAMHEALAAFFTLSAARYPLVMLLEDWHWADEASGEVIEQLVEMAAAYPLLVVVTYRPGYGLEWGAPLHPTPVHLKPLGLDTSLTILTSVLGSEDFPEEMGQLMHERTGGNPFFLEEVAKTLHEEGTLRLEGGRVVATRSLDQAHLPARVQAVIRTRLDRMDRHAQTVIRLASVVGREFTRGVLERVLPDETPLLSALEALRAGGLVQQTHVLPEAAYRFKHTLTQEAAYESILARQRKQLHSRVGTVLEALYPDRLEEHADLLAQHFSQAGDWQKAVHHGLVAARKAHGLSQFSEALQRFEDAQRWLLRQPERPDRQDTLVEILLGQELLCEIMGLRKRQQTLIDELVALVEPGGTPTRRADVFQRQGDLYTLLRRYKEAEPILQEALRLRRETGDEAGERSVIRSLGMLCWHTDRHSEAIGYVEAALQIDKRREDQDAVIGDLYNLGNVLKNMNRFDEALRALGEAVDLAERVGNHTKQLYALHTMAQIHHRRGDLEAAKTLFRHASALAGEHRTLQTSYHLVSLGNVLWEEGAVEESLQCYQEAVGITRRGREAQALGQALRVTGDRLVQLGRYREALLYLEEATTLFAQLLDPQTEALVWCKIAVCHEQQHDDPAAMAAWRKACTLCRQAGDAGGELKALEGLAEVTRRHGAEVSQALDYYREALAVAQRLEDRRAQGRLHNTLGILEWGRGAYENALAQYRQALSCFQDLDDAIHQGLMLNSIGVTMKKLGRLGEAVVCLEEGAARSREAGQSLLEGHALAVLGEIAHDRGAYAEALRLFGRSLALRHAIEDDKGEGWMLYHLARTSAALGKLSQAHEHVTAALGNATDRGDKDLIATCRRLISVDAPSLLQHK